MAVNKNVKYKKGDRVYASDNLGYYKNQPGTVTYDVPSDNGRYFVKFDDTSKCGCALYSDIHSRIYKIGDRVVASDNTGTLCNVPGTVVGYWVTMDHPTPYLVSFDYKDGKKIELWSEVHDLIPEKKVKKKPEKIIITHNGKTTTATRYYEDGSKESATANCAPEDKFDFYVGAKMALERLANKTPEVTVKGFKVGDRVKVDNLKGTIICITLGDMLGVQFDDDFHGHRCLGVKLKAGSPSRKSNCWWVKPCNATHVK